MLIDLDAAPAGRPAPRPARWFPPLLAASLLLVLGGAAVPRPPGTVPQVAHVPGPVLTTLLTDTVLYTASVAAVDESSPVDEANDVLDDAEVRAWPLTAGGPAWTIRVPAPNSEVAMSRSGGVLVVRTDAALTVLDAASGATRWQTDAYLIAAVLGDRVVRSEWDSEDGTTTLLDVASGRPLWRSPGIADFAGLDATGRHLVTLDLDGRAVVRDAATGRIRASRAAGVTPVAGEPALSIVGDQIFLLDGLAVQAIRRSDLAPLWTARAAVPSAVLPCGTLVCVVDQRGLTGVDPATGETRWRGDGWVSYADGVAMTGIGQTALFDPATGRVLRELGHGAPAGDLMLRADAGRMWVTGLRSGELLGAVPGVGPTGCAAAGAFLGCETAGWSYTVWQVIRR